MITPTNNTLARPAYLDLEAQSNLQPTTIQTYKQIYNRYLRSANESRGANPDEPEFIKPMHLVDDWFLNMGGSKPQTLNIHRSALLWMMRNTKPEGWEEAHARLTGMKQRSIYGPSAQDNQEPLPKRSRRPGRMLPQQDFELLTTALANKGKQGQTRANGANGARAGNGF